MERVKSKKAVPAAANTTSTANKKPTPALSTTSSNKSTISELKKNLAKKK